MLKKDGVGLSPPLADMTSRVEDLQRFWTELGMSGDAGCTTWDVLDSLGNRVTMLLMLDPPDVLSAESATAEAMFRIVGQIDG